MTNGLTRREFGKVALGSFPLVTAALSGTKLFGQGKPNSNYDGVQIGLITYSFYGMPAKDMIAAMTRIGISAVELMSADAEELAGAPSMPGIKSVAGGPVPATGQKLGPDGVLPRCEIMKPAMVEGEIPPTVFGCNVPSNANGMTPDQRAELDDAQKKLTEWRAAATPATWKAVRKQFDDAGIALRILCYPLAPSSITNDEIDYSFRMARDLSVEAISSSSSIDLIARVAYFADKYKIRWGGHGHANVANPLAFSSPASFEYIMSFSPYICVNLDIGHFFAAGFDPVSFIREHHDRITNIHLKDRRRNSNAQTIMANNYPWGQGATPIKEVLQLMKREHYRFPADIEFEYGCRTMGTQEEEVANCLAYARKAIEG